MDYMVVKCPLITVYEEPSADKETEKGIVSNISDEMTYGMLARVLEDLGEWLRVLTFYGYEGYVLAGEVERISRERCEALMNAHRMVTDTFSVDVVNLKSVQGVRLLNLPSGALVEIVDEALDNDKDYRRVRLLDGTEGYISTCKLAEKRFSESRVLEDPKETLEYLSKVSAQKMTTLGGQKGFSFEEVLERCFGGDEDLFRQSLVATAKRFLGAEYRWGGRTYYGLDCSGLTSVAYMLNGVLTYRDASLAEGFPIERIPFEKNRKCLEETLKLGDLLYFPGHIALYIGDGQYIHSTGLSGDFGVAINTLWEEEGAPFFRKDLWDKLYAIGGLRR